MADVVEQDVMGDPEDREHDEADRVHRKAVLERAEIGYQARVGVEIEIERRSGYNYYTDAPDELLNKQYAKWKAKIDK